MKSFQVTDDTKDRLSLLIKLRLPWLLIGLLGGIIASFVVSNFEEILTENISLAFFVPIIVYMSGAVGSQTEVVYVRNLSKGDVNFLTYLFKEFLVGLSLGIIFGLLIGLFAYFWIKVPAIAVTVGLAMFINISIAPVLGILIPELLFKEHKDPALGAGPFATVLQDIISLSIYFLVAAIIIGGNFLPF